MPLLQKLFTNIPIKDIRGNPDIRVNNLVFHADDVKPGDLYIALPGVKHDGHDYIDRAIANGASALLVQHPVSSQKDVVCLQTPDTRSALAALAAAWYQHPANELEITGVTGTNGKTTVCYLLQALLTREKPVGLLGTIEYRAGDKVIGSGLTTPAPLDLHRLFRQMREKNVEQCVMEVTSHALAQHRVHGLTFKSAVFTNITNEHLDYHGTFNEYLNTKLFLFKALQAGAAAIINADDQHAEQVIRASQQAHVVTFAIDASADIKASDLDLDKGIRMTVNTPAGRTGIRSGLQGRHNAYNILAAMAFGIANDLDVHDMAERIEKFKAVPGRFEPIECGQSFPVIVDFCHTPDALSNTLTTMRQLYGEHIITVFGCGGDRDQQKRPEMGRIASQLSQRVIITTDNPRTEDPLQIIRDIERGVPADCETHIIPDRRQAIYKALSMAKPGDAVLIAGKGHETWQEINGVRHPFDDREVVRDFFAEGE